MKKRILFVDDEPNVIERSTGSTAQFDHSYPAGWLVVFHAPFPVASRGKDGTAPAPSSDIFPYTLHSRI